MINYNNSLYVHMCTNFKVNSVHNHLGLNNDVILKVTNLSIYGALT